MFTLAKLLAAVWCTVLGVATGGHLFPETVQKNRFLSPLANGMAVLGAFYLLRDVYRDLRELTPANLVGPQHQWLSWWEILNALSVTSLMLISGALAAYRGFAREALSISGWALATIVAIVLLRTHSLQWAQQLWGVWGVVVAMIAVFLVVLALATKLIGYVADAVLDNRIGLADRIAGAVFGAARGLILAALPLYLLSDLDIARGWVEGSRPLSFTRDLGLAFIRLILIS